jgi:hypothetical protein
MPTKVYQSGDRPIQVAAVRIDNDVVTIYNVRNIVDYRDDIVSNIQDVTATPVGDLQQVVNYLSTFIAKGTTITKPDAGGGGGENNTASNVGAGAGIFKQKVGVDLELKSLIGGTGISLVNGTDDITINLTGAPTEINIVNVTTAAELPATLAANTAYIVNGEITTSQAITLVGDNAMIIGRKGRNTDKITYTGIGTFISLVDVNFTLRNITLSATDTSSRIIDADNYSTGSYNEGRDKTLSIFTCQFRNCYDVMTINGYDLVDINNTLFFYIQALNHGLEFKSTSKIELSSCELIRWFDETSLPTPSGYALVPMFCILPQGIQAGVGAVNISGCIMHPQQTQDAIKIDNASTTGFGTISANTFVTAGLTTGVIGNFDYDIQNSYIIQANQSLENGNAKGVLLLTNNLIELNNSAASGPPYSVVVNDANFVGGLGPTNPITFPVARRVITSVSNASFTYDSKINGNFAVSLNATVGVNANGNYTITIQFRQNGTPLPFVGKATIRNQNNAFIAQPISISIQGLATQGDVFDVLVSCDTADNVLLSELLISGYQF